MGELLRPPQNAEESSIWRAFLSSGDGIRTRDLRVMSTPRGASVRLNGPCLLGFCVVCRGSIWANWNH
jgi:hypothetical protein